MKRWLNRAGKSAWLVLPLVFLSCILVPVPARAQVRVGVGVGLAEISFNEPLRPGGIYALPSLPVINRGSQRSRFKLEVNNEHTWAYQDDRQPVPEEWVHFFPNEIELAPGASREVSAFLIIPLRPRPAHYFTVIQVKPLATVVESGPHQIVPSVGVRLTFDLLPEDHVWGALAHRSLSLWLLFINSPWFGRLGLGSLGLGVLALVGLYKSRIKQKKTTGHK